jgi:hypothetical protein
MSRADCEADRSAREILQRANCYQGGGYGVQDGSVFLWRIGARTMHLHLVKGHAWKVLMLTGVNLEVCWVGFPHLTTGR